MGIIDGMLQELEREAQTTRRVLERVPNDHLNWKPHEKARTLGALALHVAVVPGNVAEVASKPEVERPLFVDPLPASAAELVPALDDSIAKAKQILGGMTDETALQTWRIVDGDREVLALPRVAFLRSIMLNHWYHHRGQLSMYLRALDVSVPSIYGPSADENPFA
jgi:uncharacterized damage-inducible protein DinB